MDNKKEEAKLDEIDSIDLDIRDLQNRALILKHEILEARGWEIRSEGVGWWRTHYYTKGDHFYICEDEALACHDSTT
jgi:hypothetical protein